MRRSSTDETPYRRSPSLDSKPDTPPFTSGFHRFSGEFEYKRPPFAFGFHTTKGPQTSKGRYAQGKKYVVFYLDLSFIFLLELRRCRMAEGCMMALRYGMVFFNLLFWTNLFSRRLQEVNESNCDDLARTVVMIEVRAAGVQLLKAPGMMGTSADDSIYSSELTAVLLQRGQSKDLLLY
eukprot:superscaffoldBa00001674_g11572